MNNLDTNSMRGKLDRRYQQLYSLQSSWWPHWQELSRRIQPRRGYYLKSRRSDGRGGKRNFEIINNTATNAARMLASAMLSGVVSPTNRWFRLNPSDEDLRDNANVKRWLQYPEQTIYDSLAESNFYQHMPIIMEDAIIFGTGAYGQWEDRETIARFQSFQIGEYMLQNDDKGRATVFYREYQETVENVVNRFGRENCATHVRGLYDAGSWDEFVTIRHAVEPSSVRHENMPRQWRSAAEKWPILSIYWEPGADGDKLLDVAGFEEQAIHVMRWSRSDPDPYGRSPGMDALGDIKELDELERLQAEAISRVADPSLQGPPSAEDELDKRPGSFTPIESPEFPISSIYGNWRPDLGAVYNDIVRIEDRIKRTFYADAFILNSLQGRAQITAREIDARDDEKLQALSPVLVQINHEGLDPAIDRQFNLIIRGSEMLWQYGAGIVPPPPQELIGREIAVDYIGPLQLAQQAQKTRALLDLIHIATQLMPIDPEAVQSKVRWADALGDAAERAGIDPDSIASSDEMETARQAQLQAQEQAQQMAMIEQGTKAANNMAPIMQQLAPPDAPA